MGSITSVLSAPQLNASAVQELPADVGFSTKVAGKTHVAGVTYSGGQYVAQDPHLSGAEATGEAVFSTEGNLMHRIDVLV
jgi:hypothetical protein